MSGIIVKVMKHGFIIFFAHTVEFMGREQSRKLEKRRKMVVP